MEGIKPARYMARFHWVTIVDVRRVPPAYLREGRKAHKRSVMHHS